MKKFLICFAFAAAMLAAASCSKDEVELDMLNYSDLAFPDPIFRAYVLENFDTNGDGKISKEEALVVTTIEVSQQRQRIQSLQGIKFFTNLTYLDCSHNALKYLDVSQNTLLTYQDCSFNGYTDDHIRLVSITDLDLSNNTALTHLDCRNLDLEKLDVSRQTQLTYLDCNYNSLTDLDVSQNTQLTYLDCGYNPLTDLDVSQNTLLTYLNCGGQSLTDLDLSNNAALTYLDCNHNYSLTELDLSNNTALTYFNGDGSHLRNLEIHHTALEYLSCNYGELENLDVSGCTALKELMCERNQLKSLNVSQTALEHLWCRDNQLTILDVSETNLGDSTEEIPLSCSYNPMLKTLILKKGWEIYGVNNPRFSIPDETPIEYV